MYKLKIIANFFKKLTIIDDYIDLISDLKTLVTDGKQETYHIGFVGKELQRFDTHLIPMIRSHIHRPMTFSKVNQLIVVYTDDSFSRVKAYITFHSTRSGAPAASFFAGEKMKAIYVSARVDKTLVHDIFATRIKGEATKDLKLVLCY